MKNLRKYTILSFVLLLIAACGGDGGGDPPPELPPSATSLIFPGDNTECNEGTVLSDIESRVTFMWNASENTDSYTLNLRNLNTGLTQTFNTGNMQLDVILLRGIPYAWSVTSRADGVSQVAQSSEWRFYNAGLAVENYAPFPAGLNSPGMGTAVDAVSGEVNLAWAGEDIDGDITDYDIYFGTDNPPATLAENTSNTSLDVAVISGDVYYWIVISRDSAGNTSTSEVFEFRVN